MLILFPSLRIDFDLEHLRGKQTSDFPCKHKLSSKNYFIKMLFFDISWPRLSKPFIWGLRSCWWKPWYLRSCWWKSVSRAFWCFLKLCCSSYRDRDNADNIKSYIVRKFGKIFNLVACGDLNPPTAGGLSHLRTAGGAHMCPPADSKTTQRIDKRKKTLDGS